jgi:hypothetical protein
MAQRRSLGKEPVGHIQSHVDSDPFAPIVFAYMDRRDIYPKLRGIILGIC